MRFIVAPFFFAFCFPAYFIFHFFGSPLYSITNLITKYNYSVNNIDREDFRFWLSVTVSIVSGLAAIGSVNAHLKAGNLSRPQVLYLNNWLKILAIVGLFALVAATYYGLNLYAEKIGGAKKVLDTDSKII